MKQSKEFTEQTKGTRPDVLFFSDLKRAYDSAPLAWQGAYEIIPDARLRECKYGTWNGASSDIVGPMQEDEAITKPFSDGASYEDGKALVVDCLTFLKQNYDGKHIAIVAHKICGQQQGSPGHWESESVLFSYPLNAVRGVPDLA